MNKKKKRKLPIIRNNKSRQIFPQAAFSAFLVKQCEILFIFSEDSLPFFVKKRTLAHILQKQTHIMLMNYVYTEYFPNRKCKSKFTFSYLFIPFLCPIFCYPHTFPIRLMMSKSGGETKKKSSCLTKTDITIARTCHFFCPFFIALNRR